MEPDLSTLLLHADDGIESMSDVSPAIHLSSTYSYTSDNQHREAIYSRCGIPTVERCEAVLAEIIGAPSVTYCSGLSAIYALLAHLNPRRIYIEQADKGGYHGTLGVINVVRRLNKLEMHNLSDLKSEDAALEKGDVIWLETPLNPTGEATNIRHYTDLTEAKGAILCVDATFAPPPLQNPLRSGAHWVMHSATKYFGGHSDLLAGVLASHDTQSIAALLHDRDYLGTVMSGHTAWLLLRSLRTFELRVVRQAATATELVRRLAVRVASATRSPLIKVTHSSLQPDEFIAEQMPGGHSPTFSIYFENELQASSFPNQLRLFHHATSLGGVESLAEWRSMSDGQCDRRLVRISIGIEHVDDLFHDIEQGLTAVLSK